MNCANHPDRERVAFCQTCGKPLCGECVRAVGASVYCAPCQAAGAVPPGFGTGSSGYGYPAGAAGYPPASASVPASEPSPGLAALLGFIPGVGAMYNGQYAKGIVHLIVFVVLVSVANDIGVFGIFIAGWIFYMVIEAHHTARARRDGTPLPNPFGLNDLDERLGFGRSWSPTYKPPTYRPGTYKPGTYKPGTPNAQAPYVNATGAAPDPAQTVSGAYFHEGADGSRTYSAGGAYFHEGADGSQTYAAPGAPPYAVPPVPPASQAPPMPPYPDTNFAYYHRFPTGAVWLIVLGLLFLTGNNPFFRIFHGRLFGPVVLMGWGVWIFVRRMMWTGAGQNDGTPMYRWRLARAVRGALGMILAGFIWMLDALHVLTWGISWPLILIGVGVMMFLRRAAWPDYGYGGYGPMPGYGYGVTPPPAAPGPTAATSTALVQVDPQIQPGTDDREGR